MHSGFDYRKLSGKIKEVCGTQSNLAESCKMNPTTLSLKMNNHVEFSQGDIIAICSTLSICKECIGDYFFTQKV